MSAVEEVGRTKQPSWAKAWSPTVLGSKSLQPCSTTQWRLNTSTKARRVLDSVTTMQPCVGIILWFRANSCTARESADL